MRTSHRYFALSFVVFCLCLCTALSLTAQPVPKLYRPTHVGPSPLWYDPLMVAHAGYLIRSYNCATGKDLVSLKLLESDPVAAAKSLFFLPDRVVVSHGTQVTPDGPVLNYGNSVALKRWGASWEQLTNMPSKYTAEPVEQEERQAFLRQVLEDGYIENYSGVRISLDKSRFRMLDGTVWNVALPEFEGLIGQAATFSQWDDL